MKYWNRIPRLTRILIIAIVIAAVGLIVNPKTWMLVLIMTVIGFLFGSVNQESVSTCMTFKCVADHLLLGF